MSTIWIVLKSQTRAMSTIWSVFFHKPEACVLFGPIVLFSTEVYVLSEQQQSRQPKGKIDTQLNINPVFSKTTFYAQFRQIENHNDGKPILTDNAVSKYLIDEAYCQLSQNILLSIDCIGFFLLSGDVISCTCQELEPTQLVGSLV